TRTESLSSPVAVGRMLCFFFFPAEDSQRGRSPPSCLTAPPIQIRVNPTCRKCLHFHAVHFMRTLPTGSVDPNFGRRVRNRRQLNSLQNTWPYGYSMPIAVRYTQDAFSRSGWLWPVDAKGEPLKATSYMEIGRASCRERG